MSSETLAIKPRLTDDQLAALEDAEAVVFPPNDGEAMDFSYGDGSDTGLVDEMSPEGVTYIGNADFDDGLVDAEGIIKFNTAELDSQTSAQELGAVVLKGMIDEIDFDLESGFYGNPLDPINN